MKAKNLQLCFIGRIISCYTHEVNNYLAIIKETDGLMKDVLQIKKSRGVDEKQFLGLVGCVEDQIKRATAITDYLNRFAHRMEKECSSVNINDLVDELLALISRLAYRKRITISKNLGGLPETVLDPTLFHYLLFCVIESKMSCLDRNGIVSVSTFFSDGCFRIAVSSEGTAVPLTGPAGVGEVRDVASELGATVSENGGETVITLPAVVQTDADSQKSS